MITVAEAAARLGISVSSIRHYEKQFELRFARTKAGQRLLSERDLENLRIIRSFRSQNLPIEDIRKQLTLPEGELEEARPSVEEVLSALIARQDELERIVAAQQTLLNQLSGENQRLMLAQEQVKLLLEAPKQPDPVVEQLAEQVAALESRQEQELKDFAHRLESLAAEVQAMPEAPEEGLDAVQSRLSALEAEIRARAEAGAEDPAIADLRAQLEAVERELSTKSKAAELEQIKGLQRRMLDLESAVATRDDGPGHDEEGLLDSLVEAIREDVRSRRPWWRFWK